MLPSRSTLRAWNPDALAAAAAEVRAQAQAVVDSVTGIADACERMPEARAWSGQAHDAAVAMFDRGRVEASKLFDYADTVASSLCRGADTIGQARKNLLAEADSLDGGPLYVTDDWVVRIVPRYLSKDEMAERQEQARQMQETINTRLAALGDADDATAAALTAAGKDFGFVAPGPPGSLGDLMLPGAQRPENQVPDPRTPVGLALQAAILAADQQQMIREIIESTNEYGDETKTVIKQDGSWAVTTRMDPFDWPSRMDFYQTEEFDKNGEFVARTSSWHDLSNNCSYFSITYPNNANWTTTRDPSGHVTSGFTTPDGRHRVVPVDLIDSLSLTTTSAMSGLEKHIAHGGSLPMITAESVENIGKTMKYGGPAVTAATTVFNMMMAESDKDRCIALLAGAAGGGGGWAMAEFGATLGAATGPFAIGAVPLFAFSGAAIGGMGGAALGEFIGEALCPY
ncbi:hypothetical protein MPHL43072_20910 [Mycolicibacterium phlei DSM 43072]|uniref:hypothetical protein n=1 Tax=Mycolicibacterium phlei TaxID=1771 RepID=UPI000776FD25|nr:hypothetical protein [Mycolicibacterium phlei]KXW70040.1 hypothetical protein MPHL43072_20910 [Mycolicibacterium phlei DSM 43072]